MNRKPVSDRPFLAILILILFGGLFMVFGASAKESLETYGSPYTMFIRQLIAVGIGLGLMMVASRVDYRLYRSPYFVVPVMILTTGLLVAVLFGPEINHVNRWIVVAGTRFQPSEGAKLAVIILTASVLANRGGKITSIDRNLVIYLMTVGAVFALILREPDFGTASSILLTATALLFIAGLPIRVFAIGSVTVLIPGFYFFVYKSSYRWERIISFLDPDADPLGAGYQLIQSKIAVGSGGLFGVGLNQSVQKRSFLPEPHTDFIYAVIGEETGLIGSVLVVVLFAALIFWAFRMAFNAHTIFGMYVGVGITIMIAFQALFNMSVVIGITPTKGIPLPFVSVGGTSILAMLLSAGILLNISRQAHQAQGRLFLNGEDSEEPGEEPLEAHND